jgi:hypothetical protein
MPKLVFIFGGWADCGRGLERERESRVERTVGSEIKRRQERGSVGSWEGLDSSMKARKGVW